MSIGGTTQIAPQADHEIVITRDFRAPRPLVFDAWTKPAMLRRWLGVMAGWEWAVCELDLRVGGAYRYEWRGPDDAAMGVGGVFREVMPPTRLISTERFDQAWYPGEGLVTLDLSERGGVTAARMTLRYETPEARDGVLHSPMDSGMEQGFAALDELLAAETARAR